jgi:hypothetical protein
MLSRSDQVFYCAVKYYRRKNKEFSAFELSENTETTYYLINKYMPFWIDKGYIKSKINSKKGPNNELYFPTKDGEAYIHRYREK